MTSVPDSSFRAALAALDHGTATAFVAAVYAARGWAVDRDGGDLRATPPDADRPRRLLVDVGEGGTTETADGVVVDAATLHELLAYALAAEDRSRLCLEFLGREFESFDAAGGDGGTAERGAATSDGPTGTASTRRERGAGRLASDAPTVGDDRTGATAAGDDGAADVDGGRGTVTARRERLLELGVTVVALSLVLGGLVTAAGPGVAGPAAAVFGADGTTTGAETSTPGTHSAPNGSLPPGLDEDGIENARRLADAHEATLDERSFRLRIVHREFVDDDLRGVGHERAAVSAQGRYLSDVRRFGTLDHASPVIGAEATYSNGDQRYVRSADDGDAAGESPVLRLRTTMATTDPNRLVDRTERYVQWYLGVMESRHVGTIERDGTTLYVIDFDGDPWPGATDVSGRALVSETGIVREIRRTYVPRGDQSTRIETVIRITPDHVRVTRPNWVPIDGPPHGVADSGETDGRNDTHATVPRPPRNASAVTDEPTPPRLRSVLALDSDARRSVPRSTGSSRAPLRVGPGTWAG